jgi:hypothetical protein
LGRFGRKAGKQRFGRSLIKLGSTVLGDSVAKLGIDGLADDGLADSELKGGSTGLPVNRRSPKGVPIYGNRSSATISWYESVPFPFDYSSRPRGVPGASRLATDERLHGAMKASRLRGHE